MSEEFLQEEYNQRDLEAKEEEAKSETEEVFGSEFNYWAWKEKETK